MAAPRLIDQPFARVCLAGFLSWLLPGAGHVAIGCRTRGLILMVTIAITFWTGVAIGGVQDTVQPRKRFAWFLAQTCAGVHGLAACSWSERARAAPNALENANPSYASVDTGVVYSGIAGLLSLLVILDAIGRADAPVEQAAASAGRSARERAP
ncbi:MAG: hypothetical protein JXB13_05180 [Phycisphaerae bacterium]|nr:hypothetical protein [Phycisphaerae bacterium]